MSQFGTANCNTQNATQKSLAVHRRDLIRFSTRKWFQIMRPHSCRSLPYYLQYPGGDPRTSGCQPGSTHRTAPHCTAAAPRRSPAHRDAPRTAINRTAAEHAAMRHTALHHTATHRTVTHRTGRRTSRGSMFQQHFLGTPGLRTPTEYHHVCPSIGLTF